MKTILKIFKNDLIGIKKSILTIVLAIGLCILPALYAWFNIFANWDPYANTGNINIAVVNLDTGYTDENGCTSNMGQSIVEKLKRQTSIGWVFPDTEATAIDGVKSGSQDHRHSCINIKNQHKRNIYKGCLTETHLCYR